MGLVLTVLAAGAVSAAATSAPPSLPPVSYPPSEVDADWQATGECLLGHWYLDTEDYEAQAAVYLKSLGIPLEALELTGTIRVSVYNEGSPEPNYLDITSSLFVTASVMGHTLSAPGEYSGGGAWFMAPQPGDPDIQNTSNFIEVDHWAWGIEPAGQQPDAAPIPPLIDPANGAMANCEGDLLTLHGPGAPLVGHFRRGEAPPQSALPPG